MFKLLESEFDGLFTSLSHILLSNLQHHFSEVSEYNYIFSTENA